MNKENVLYSVVGLLLGYVVAFTFVIYANQREVAKTAGGPGAAASGSLPAGHPDISAEEAKFREELKAVDAEARQRPDDYELQMKAADMHLTLHEYEEAIDFLTVAQKLKPDDYRVVVELGNANFEANRYELAEQFYKEALKRNPDDTDVRTDLGLTYFFRKPRDTESALAEFRRALEHDPEHELTLQNITAVLTQRANDEETDAGLKRKAVEEAEQTLARLEAVNPQNPTVSNFKDSIRRARATLGGGARADAKVKG